MTFKFLPEWQNRSHWSENASLLLGKKECEEIGENINGGIFRRESERKTLEGEVKLRVFK